MSTRALAQGDPLAGETAPGSDAAATPPAEAPAETSPAEAPPAETPPAPAVPPAPTAAPAAKAETAAPVETMPPASSPASGTSVEREKTVAFVGIELLPGSAYPSLQVRGIKYGSLSATFHGAQWPYMPLIEGGEALRIGISGSIWNDLSHTKLFVDNSLASSNASDHSRWNTQTRGVFRVTPTYNAKGGWFVQGNAELVTLGDQTPDTVTKLLATTDDLWVRAGKWNLFDVTVGRFQGWEIANHYGMALDQNTLERYGALVQIASIGTPTDGYGLSYFWDRQNFTLGGYALHAYPTEYLRFELLGHIGAGGSPYAGTANQFDVRPAAIFDIGWVKLKAGLEYGLSRPQVPELQLRDRRNGYGFAAQFVLAPYVEFGASFARGFQDVEDINGNAALDNSNTVQTYGGFVNGSPGYEPLVLGVGFFQNHFEDFFLDGRPGPHFGEVDTNDQRQLFAAVQYTLWERLSFKFVVAHARHEMAHFNFGVYENEALSFRFRSALSF